MTLENKKKRIKFSKDEQIARRDKATFEAYKQKQIPLNMAIIDIGRRNKCLITEEQFLFEYEYLGYKDPWER